ncbi:MAG: valine--tRNA ligase [Clostridiaceae bacterium]|nr:valine--tRNA ligase [Clostridiaceae bacterium]
MKSIDQIPRAFEPPKEEPELYEKWLSSGAFHPEAPSDKESFCIVMPPPNITGELHMGHALDNSLPDVLTRFQRMRGKNALFLPGTDHASIATEAVVVQRMREEGLSKEEIGREAFLERAWRWKNDYNDRIIAQQQRLGLSCDWQRQRFTMDEGLSRAVTRVFVDLFREGLIYRGERMINWCPSCATSISDIEVEHEEREGNFYTIRYPFAEGEGFVEIATTRPETMLADTAVAVHPDDERNKPFVGRQIRLPLTDRVIPIIADSYVDPDFGTGFVKITPAHDPNDYEIGLRHNLPVIDMMTLDGRLSDECGKYAGMTVLEARDAVANDLESQGLLVKKESMRHNIGTCQRCHNVVEPKISLQWFVRMEPLAGPAIQAVRDGDTRFVPDHFKKTYFNWMENIRDWCISRQLWWGHRIPAWYCDECGEMLVAEMTPDVCPSCGSNKLTQEEDTLDTWFSSALWPFSTLGWPDQTVDYETFYPTDVLVPGYDIIFFWVARMIFSALHHTGQVPFHTVLIHGLVRDESGRKMSKSLGNGVNPLEIIDLYGADALRYGLIVGNSPGNDLRCRDEKFENGRNFINKIWNAFRFIVMNLENDLNFTDVNPSDYTLEDRWIMSELKETITEVTDHFENLELGLAIEKIYVYLWDYFCDWYIELVKERLREGGTTGRVAQAVLYRVFSDTLALLHPFMPFVTERIYGILHEDELLISSLWPDADNYTDDLDAVNAVTSMIDAIRAVRNVRAEYKIAPQRRFAAKMKTHETNLASRLADAEQTLSRLAGISGLTLFPADEPFPDEDISIVFQGGEIAIALRELIDVVSEAERLDKEAQLLRDEIARATAMLANPQFTEKAPQRVVDQQREKQSQYEIQLTKIEEQISRLEELQQS